MTHPTDFEISIRGPQAADVADRIAAAWRDAFDREAVSVAEVRASPRLEHKADPLAVAAFVISLPSAVLATMDLAKRLELAEKLRPLFEALKAANAALDEEHNMQVKLPGGAERTPDSVDVPEVLDAAEKASRKSE